MTLTKQPCTEISQVSVAADLPSFRRKRSHCNLPSTTRCLTLKIISIIKNNDKLLVGRLTIVFIISNFRHIANYFTNLILPSINFILLSERAQAFMFLILLNKNILQQFVVDIVFLFYYFYNL